MMRIDGHRTPTAAMPCAVNVWTKNIKPQRTTKPCREKLNVYGIAWFAWWLDIEDLRKCRQYHKWHLNPSQEALHYFQTKISQLKLFRAKPVDLPDEIARMVLADDATAKETVVYERVKKAPKKKK